MLIRGCLTSTQGLFGTIRPDQVREVHNGYHKFLDGLHHRSMAEVLALGEPLVAICLVRNPYERLLPARLQTVRVAPLQSTTGSDAIPEAKAGRIVA